MLRRSLDRLYDASGFVSCIFLAMIGVTIIAQIAGRFVGITFDATEVSGFCMAASTFLGLAYTLRHEAHIRITLLVGRLPAAGKRWAEIWCTAVATLASAYFAVNAVEMTIDSFTFGDVSPGLMAVPFWIAQTPMAIGAIILTIAFADSFVAVTFGGHQPAFIDAEAAALGDVQAEAAE
jgi:TRAP-type C4-dicarboxylate transport system permease small subunit